MWECKCPKSFNPTLNGLHPASSWTEGLCGVSLNPCVNESIQIKQSVDDASMMLILHDVAGSFSHPFVYLWCSCRSCHANQNKPIVSVVTKVQLMGLSVFLSSLECIHPSPLHVNVCSPHQNKPIFSAFTDRICSITFQITQNVKVK